MILKTAEGQAFLEVLVSGKRCEELRCSSVIVRSNLNHVKAMGVRSLVQNGLRVWLWIHPKANCLESVYQQISMAA